MSFSTSGTVEEVGKGSTVDGSSAEGELELAHLGAHLPVGVVVIDADGNLVHANARAAELTGYGRDELTGTSALDLFHPDDADFVRRALAAAPDDDTVMGPIRLRYRGRDGRQRWSEFWAQRATPALGFAGFVVTMANESVSDFLAGVAIQIASDAPLDVSLAAVARALGGFPLLARGSIVLRRRDHFDVIGEWPLAAAPTDALTDVDAMPPWQRVLLDGEPVDLDAHELPEHLAEAAVRAGVGAIWVRPVIDQRGQVAAAVVAWRDGAGPPSPTHARQLAEAVSTARLAIAHDDHRDELERAALTDHLTGLGNRAHLAQRLATIDDRGVAVLYVDLDGFKSVNDAHGHEVGDLVLRAAARRLQTIVRSSDEVFRIGGDEFVVFCAGADADDRSALEQIAERIVAIVDDPFRVGDQLIHIGASVGIAERVAGESTRDVIRRADHALLAAKRAGKRGWYHARAG